MVETGARGTRLKWKRAIRNSIMMRMGISTKNNIMYQQTTISMANTKNISFLMDTMTITVGVTTSLHTATTNTVPT
jgi:hypothetical protein